MKGAYYNEFDPFAAAWLRELIAAGLIAPGEVDTRSIEDVQPSDLLGFKQHHFFAGIGIWSLALRQAGWGDDRAIWSGSCPCQPFSAAGQGGGFADERHLWPAFHHLIRELRPERVVGEQVASKDGLGWLDLVQADMEAERYAFGAIDTCAAGFGAPHIRQRLYWVADANNPRLEGRIEPGRERAAELAPGASVLAGGLAYTDGGDASAERKQRGGEQRQQPQDGVGVERVGISDSAGSQSRGLGSSPTRHGRPADAASGVGRMADAEHAERRPECEVVAQTYGRNGLGRSGHPSEPAPTNGLWGNVDWLGCRDGKWRPVEPGTFPLVNAGTFRNRVGELRGAGNAINLAQAQAFIEAAFGTNGAGGLT